MGNDAHCFRHLTLDDQSTFNLAAPVSSIDELPSALQDAPIDRPELLEHLGQYRFVSGKISKFSHLTPNQKQEIKQQAGFGDFKGYALTTNAQIVIPDNSIPPAKRKRIQIDHLWSASFDGDSFEMYQEVRALNKIVIYQRMDGSLAIGADRNKIDIPSDLYDGISSIDVWSEDGFFNFIEEVIHQMSEGDLVNETMEAKAEVINTMCNDAIDMAQDGRLRLWHETSASFKQGISNHWKSEWMITAGVTGAINREGRRRSKSRTSIHKKHKGNGFS